MANYVYFHAQTDDYCFHQSDWFSLLGAALRCGWQPQGLRHLFDPTVPRILPSDEFQKMLDEFIGIITDDDVDIVEEYSPSLYPYRDEFIKQHNLKMLLARKEEIKQWNRFAQKSYALSGEADSFFPVYMSPADCQAIASHLWKGHVRSLLPLRNVYIVGCCILLSIPQLLSEDQFNSLLLQLVEAEERRYARNPPMLANRQVFLIRCMKLINFLKKLVR